MFSTDNLKQLAMYLIVSVAFGIGLHAIYIKSRFQSYPNFHNNDSFDYIVIGAGSAGSVVASRLTETRGPVLLLEAGVQDNILEVKIPAAFPKLFHGPYDWNYYTVPQSHLNNRKEFWPRGKLMGGSGSMNAMIFSRGNARDFDEIGKVNKGWSYREVLPYFISQEKNKRGNVSSAYHGFVGNLVIDDQRSIHESMHLLMKTLENNGIPYNADINGELQEGVSFLQTHQQNGRRWSSADGYLNSAVMERPNMFLRHSAHVTKILFEGKRAVGVEFLEGGEKRVVRATKEVILCAGTVNTPQLLMLSGIGPQDHLRQLNIPVVLNLPGVGQNLHDHVFITLSYNTSLPSLHTEETLANIWDWVKNGEGPMTSPCAEVIAFEKSSPKLPAPDIELLAGPLFYIQHGAKIPSGNGVTLGAILLKPKSRGSLKLKTGNPLDAPLIDPNYLAESDDLNLLIKYVKRIRKLMDSKPIKDYLHAEVHPGKQEVETDQQIEEFIRNELMTIYHPVGTCKMGPKSDYMAVVDEKLLVHGLENVRVIDASIFPNIISGHTHSATVMIAEKVSEYIKIQHYEKLQRLNQ